jgi:hypothetical protein
MRFGSSVQEATISGELPTWSTSSPRCTPARFTDDDVASGWRATRKRMVLVPAARPV